MKNKVSLRILIVFGISLFGIPNCIGQDDDNNASPGTKDYDVQRVYDKEGNLLYYDSTLVSAETPNPNNAEFDSLVDAWKKEDKIVNYSVRFPNDSFSYSFQLPEGFFDFAPEYEFDIEVPDLDSLFKGFNYYFSIDPTDSCKKQSKDKPLFEFHGKVPKIDPDLDSKLWEMERKMFEFQDRLLDEYEEWEQKNNSERKTKKVPPPPPPPPPKPSEKSKPIDI